MNSKISIEKYNEVDFKNLTVGFVFDDPEFQPDASNSASQFCFPQNWKSEWESKATLDALVDAWKQLGVSVELFPLNKHFFERWLKIAPSLNLVHSVVEGWGSVAREGWIPSLCELSGIPIIGCSPSSHSVCQRKSWAKDIVRPILQSLNAKVPWGFVALKQNLKHLNSSLKEELENYFHKGQSVFVKPDVEGSGMGISVETSYINSMANLEQRLNQELEMYPEGLLIEERIVGREFTVGMLNGQVLPAAEILVESNVYGEKEKSKERRDEKIVFHPASASHSTSVFQSESESVLLCKRLENLTLECASALRVSEFVRIDWMVNNIGDIYFLEANTLPGLSPIYSVFPEIALQAGISLSQLLGILGKSALKNERQYRYGRYCQSRA